MANVCTVEMTFIKNETTKMRSKLRFLYFEFGIFASFAKLIIFHISYVTETPFNGKKPCKRAGNVSNTHGAEIDMKTDRKKNIEIKWKS